MLPPVPHSITSTVIMWGALIRSVPVAAPAVRGYATNASTDPVQKIFVDKLSHIFNVSSPGS